MQNYETNPRLTFLEAVKIVLSQKYCTFSGRARRSEYWWFSVFGVLCCAIAITLDMLLGINFGEEPYGPIYCVVGLAFVLPSLAVQVRRLHDINKSGWNVLWGFIPLLGGLILLVFYCMDSKKEANKYGESPKYRQVQEMCNNA